MRRIGVLMNVAADDAEGQARIAAFLQVLQQLGWTDGRNVRIDYRWAAGDAGRFQRYAEELLALAPDVILASATPSVQALQQATRTVPIVFANVGDPVGMGVVESLARPGGNATGFTPLEFGFGAKWLELLKEIAPRVTRVAVLRDLTIGPALLSAIQAVAPSFNVELSVVGVRDASEIERSVTAFARSSNGGMIVTASTSALVHRDLITMLAARHRLPAVYAFRYMVTAGGLISYGPDTIDPVPARGRLRRSHPQGREAGRPAGAGADQVRAGDQPQDRQGARPRSAAVRARPRRRGDRMRRREFITLLGGAAAAWPLAARAQQRGRMRRVGVLMSYLESDPEAQDQTRAFGQSLKEFGWIEGENLRQVYRWPGSNPEQLRANAMELVRSVPDVLFAGATPAVIALKNETRSIPIVFANVADPVGQHLVTTLAHPDANITGFGAFEFSIAGKWVDTIKELVPTARQIGVVFNPETAPFFNLFLPFIETAAHQAGIGTKVAPIHDAAEITTTITKLVKESNADALIVLPGARFTAAREFLISTAAQLRLPAVYPYSYYARGGGLVSYGFQASDMYRRAASYVDRILRGANPSDLPVQQPTRFELVFNLKTAKALSLDIPPTLLARADEVIE